MSSSRIRAIIGGLAALLVISGCGSAPDDGEDAQAGADTLDALIEAARAEGELLWYSGPAPAVAEGITKAFEEKYGIRTEFIRITTSQLTQRFAAEASSGAPGADVILVSTSPFDADAVKNGWVTPLADANLPDFPGDYPERFLRPDIGSAVVNILPYGFAYNTDEVTAADAPTAWGDLLDPRWSNGLVLPDPRSGATYLDIFNAVVEFEGEAYLEQLADQSPRYVTDTTAGLINSLSSGERLVAPMAIGSFTADAADKGAPVDFLLPEETSGAEVVMHVASAARHPNAARLFAHFILSEEGNSALNDFVGSVSPRSPDLPEGYISPSDGAGLPVERILELLGLA